MVNIADKAMCCGCNACGDVCAHDAIKTGINIDNWTNLFTQSAISTLAFVYLRIPKSFNIRFESNCIMSTHVATGVATATHCFICNINHINDDFLTDSFLVNLFPRIRIILNIPQFFYHFLLFRSQSESPPAINNNMGLFS